MAQTRDAIRFLWNASHNRVYRTTRLCYMYMHMDMDMSMYMCMYMCMYAADVTLPHYGPQI